MPKSGTTTVAQGILQVQDGSLPAASNLALRGGVFQSTGIFTRAFGTAPGQVQLTSPTSGFAAAASKLSLNFGSGTTQFMGSGAFSTSTLVLNSATALAEVEIVSPLNFGIAPRTIQVDDNANTATDFATISGALSGGITNALGAVTLTKTGAGNLILFGANNYLGDTVLANGALIVNSIGAEGATSSSVG